MPYARVICYRPCSTVRSFFCTKDCSSYRLPGVIGVSYDRAFGTDNTHAILPFTNKYSIASKTYNMSLFLRVIAKSHCQPENKNRASC